MRPVGIVGADPRKTPATLRRETATASRLPFQAWQWLVVLSSAGMFFGAVIDAWSHVWIPTLDPVLNVWHAPVYASFVVLAAGLTLPSVGRIARGRGIATAIPRALRLPLAGGVLFLLCGLMDIGWHAVFGIEIGVEALLSPTHLGLAVGAGLMWSAPLRLAWRRRGPRSTWSAAAPALISAALLMGLTAFTTHFAHPLVDPWPAYAFSEADARSWYVPNLGYAGLVIQIAITMGFTLALIRRWPQLPIGALTLVYVVSSSSLALLHDEAAMTLVPLIAGLIADAMRGVLLAGRMSLLRIRLFAALVPATTTLTYLALLEIVSTVRWSIHLSAGLVVMAAGVGLLVSLLAFPPQARATDASDA